MQLPSRHFVHFFHQNTYGMKNSSYFCTTRTRQASQRCSNVRVVFLIPMPNRIPFHKIYTNAQDLVLLLQSRGLTVNDPAKAERYLEYIGYYRLSAYMYPLLQMPKELHQYKQDTSFDQVMTLYRFDKKLRLLIFNEIEKIEVAVRRDKLLNLLADYPSIDQAAMGFPLGWQQEPLWQ